MSEIQIIIIRNSGDRKPAHDLIDGINKFGDYSCKLLTSDEFLAEEPNFPAHQPIICIGGPNANIITKQMLNDIELIDEDDMVKIGFGFNKAVVYGEREVNSTQKAVYNFNLNDHLKAFLESLELDDKASVPVYVVAYPYDIIASRILSQKISKIGYTAYFWNRDYYYRHSDQLKKDSVIISIGKPTDSFISDELEKQGLTEIYSEGQTRIKYDFPRAVVYGLDVRQSTLDAVNVFCDNYLSNFLIPLRKFSETEIEEPDSVATQIKKVKISRIANFTKNSDQIEWSNITIELVSEDSILVKAPDFKTKRFNYTDLGMRDGRKGDLPNQLWDMIKYLAMNNGILPTDEISFRSRGKIEKTIQRLRSHFRTVFGIEGMPINRYSKKHGYVTQFNIKDCRPTSYNKPFLE